MGIYKKIQSRMLNCEKSLAVLLDPEGLDRQSLKGMIGLCREAHVDFIFLGGSFTRERINPRLIEDIKAQTEIPCILFPGQLGQLDNRADALLLLSLISGRNPEYLITKHVEAAMTIKKLDIETIPTGYILIDGGRTSSVQYITQSVPIPSGKSEIAAVTALAGQQLGMKLIYLEAGSGALVPVKADMISSVKKEISVPLIVGGGIKDANAAQEAVLAGADIVVIGNAFQNEGVDLFDFSAAIHSVNRKPA